MATNPLRPITLDAQLRAHKNDKEKTKATLARYISIYEKRDLSNPKFAFRLQNFKTLINKL